jgi:hypothetical protein
MNVYTVVVKYVQGINEIDLARNQTSQQSIALLFMCILGIWLYLLSCVLIKAETKQKRSIEIGRKT